MVKKLQHAFMALVMAFGFMASAAPQAEAGHGHGHGVGLGIAAGIIGLGILGAARAHADDHYYSRYDEGCYYGRRECHWAGRRCFENEWGDTVCRGGRYICDRPLICD